MNEPTRREETLLAGAALRGAPWKTAAVAGGAVTTTSLLLGLAIGSVDLSGALYVGITLFSLISGIGAISKPDRGDQVTQQTRRWSLQHPWRFALYPAAGSTFLMYPVQLILAREGAFEAAWDAAWGGAMIYLITALLALSMRGRALKGH
ncbi:hypothetical protein GCM10009555_009880 [Acrocarpospora macrocephala]|uniref:Uncharacterized protein n=1 Tax=Acrocarpospora macrocephala TaxID=150177 RepID=A0A5M3WTA3_9ACTN|nr:hypothetical protein [Acrocarpospora macrocephala]GES10521.1 hypothetical protein Amac_041180 [Acrocarpospora macrocephala]